MNSLWKHFMVGGQSVDQLISTGTIISWIWTNINNKIILFTSEMSTRIFLFETVHYNLARHCNRKASDLQQFAWLGLADVFWWGSEKIIFHSAKLICCCLLKTWFQKFCSIPCTHPDRTRSLILIILCVVHCWVNPLQWLPNIYMSTYLQRKPLVKISAATSAELSQGGFSLSTIA